jgi:hypothetical protein
VLTRRGKVIYENDLMKLPMQLLTFTMASQNKFLTSFVQGRDRSPLMGMATLMGSAYLVDMLATDSQTWKRRTWDQHMMKAAKRAGLGGYWLGDLPQMLDRASSGQLSGAITGNKPKKRTQGERISDIASAFGPAVGTYTDIARTFADPEMSAQERAQMIRKMTIYGQILWWDRITRDMTSEGVSTVEELF